MTTLIARPHPLRSDIYEVDLGEGAVLSSIVPQMEGLHAQVNGTPWPQSRWGEVLPAGVVHVVAVPGDDGILGSVLQVAVAVAAAYVGFTIGGPWGAVAAAGINIAGSTAINMLIPPKTPDASTGTQSGSTIRSSLTGSQNRANPYGVIPRVYGNPRWFPPKAGNDVTESAGDDQYLRMLLCLGYGPLEIAGHRVGPGLPLLANADVGAAIRIGETNLGEYDEVSWEIGTRDQLTLYTQDIVEEVPGVALDLQDRTTGKNLLSSQDDVSAVRTTAVDATEISVDVVWPSGLYAMNSTGDMSPVNVEMLIEQREVGQSEWITQRSVVVSSESKTTVRKNWSWSVPKGQYDVRVTRVRTDGPNREAVVSDAQWSALRTIQGDNEAYGNDRHVLMALRIKATDQLNGVVDQLSIRTQSVLRVWNGESFTLDATNNPAWAYLDALTGEQVPRPITDDQVNLPEIQAWAAFCDETGLGYSWVHDGNETLFQRCRAIASTGQGSFSLQDGLYGVVRDSPSEPVTQMITPRNASNVRASRQYRKLPHGIRVKYVDFETGAATGTDAELIVYRDGFTEQNATIFEDFETQGVTSATEASFQGNYYLRQAILRPETFTADMDWENLAAVRGNRCSLASDVLKVGLASARISAIDDVNNRITLDSEVEYTTERQYGLRVRQQDGEQVLIPVTADEVGYVDTLSIGDEDYDLQPGDLVTYGVLDRETIDTKITRVDPGPDFTATLTLVPAAIDIYDFANDPIYDPGITNPIDPNQVAPPAPVITSARGDSTAASRNADGSYRTLIRVSYIFPVRVGSPTVQVEARYRLLSNPQWSHAGPFPATGSLAIADIEQHAEYGIQVRARNRDRVSAWSAEVALDVIGQAAIAPTGVDAEVGTFSVTLRPVTIYAGSLFRFYRSAVELQPSQVESGAVNLGVAAVMVDTDLQPGTDYWYYVQAYTVYSSSEFYVLKVTTREDFDAILGAVDEDLRKPGGLVDQFENGINDNAEQIAAARTDFEDGLAEANAGIERTDALIGEIGTEVDQLTSNVDTELAGVNQRIGAANDRIDGIETDQAAAEEALGNLDTEIDQLSSDVETEFSGVNDQIADANQRIDGVESIAEGADTKADILAEDVSTLDSRADGHDAEISETNRIARLNGMLEAFERQAAQVQTAAGSAAYTVERIQRISQGQSLSQATEELDARLSGNIATARSQITTLVDTTQSITDSLTELRSEYEGTSAEFDSRITAVTTQAQAIADYVLNLKSEVEDGFATVQSRITTVANESEALSQDIRTLRSEYEGFSAEADQRLTTLANDQQAMTQSLQALSASYDASTADFDERITTLADEQKATAQSLSHLSTAYGETTSDFEQRISALSSATEGLVEETSRLSTQLGDAEAAIENVRRVQRFDGLLSAFERQVSQVQTAAGSAAYTVERIQRISQGESLSQATEELDARLSGNIATARSQITALVTTTESITSQLTGLRSEYEGTSTEFDDRITLLASEAESLGSHLEALTSETDGSLADVRSQIETVANDAEALGQSLDSLRTSYEGFSAEADQRLTVLSNQQQSMAQSLASLGASYDDSTADFDERITTLADEQKATAQSLSQLSTAYGETTSDFEQRISALSSATEGLVEEVSSLSTQLGDAEAVIENVRRVQRFDGLLTAFQSSATQVQTSAGGAAIRFDRLVSVNERQALAQQTEEVKTEFGQTTSNLRSALSSLSSEQQALAQDLLDLNAELGDTSANLHSELAALSDGVSAVSQRQDEYRVEVDDQFASVEDNISAVYDPDTGAVAQAITTVNVNGKTGMLGLQAFGEEIQIVGVADEFAILNPISGELVTAFVVTGGKVVIPQALIDSLVVTKLRSTNGNLVFDGNKLKADYIDAVNLKVKWANVQDIIIQWADIQDVKIKTADIEDAAVTTLKIAGQAVTLPQSNYQEGNRYFKRSNTGSSG
ncbi:hypothetical protein F0A16_13915, partial [Salinicola corii]